MAEVAALLKGGEVEEAEVDGLFELVHVRRHNRDDGDVGLLDLHRVGRVGIDRGVLQGIAELCGGKGGGHVENLRCKSV